MMATWVWCLVVAYALGLGFAIGSWCQLRWYEKDLDRLIAKSKERDTQLTALIIDMATWKKTRYGARQEGME